MYHVGIEFYVDFSLSVDTMLRFNEFNFMSTFQKCRKISIDDYDMYKPQEDATVDNKLL